jgi:L-2-hydroxyglutarate oxidase LhgO
VLHAGIYYQKDSFKAKFCVESVIRMNQYLLDRKIPYQRCGKLIVATSADELSSLDRLYEKAQRNGVINLQKISQLDAKAFEPEVYCVGALWSPSTSVFDSHSFLTSLVSESEDNGTNFVYNCQVMSVECHLDPSSRFTVKTSQGDVDTDLFINACGLDAPRLRYQSPSPSLASHLNERTPTPFFLKGNYFKYDGLESSLLLDRGVL